jgi:hypothetical protein
MSPMKSRRMPMSPAIIQPTGRWKRRSSSNTSNTGASPRRLNGVSTPVQPSGRSKRRRARARESAVRRARAEGTRWSPRTMTQSSVMRAS